MGDPHSTCSKNQKELSSRPKSRSDVAEGPAVSLPFTYRRGRALLAEALLRFQCPELSTVVEKLRYIHRNQVKKGLCERPEDWEWSSFLHYATGHEGRIESEWTARKRERAAERLCPTVELAPLKSKEGLNGTRPNCSSAWGDGIECLSSNRDRTHSRCTY